MRRLDYHWQVQTLAAAGAWHLVLMVLRFMGVFSSPSAPDIAHFFDFALITHGLALTVVAFLARWVMCVLFRLRRASAFILGDVIATVLCIGGVTALASFVDTSGMARLSAVIFLAWAVPAAVCAGVLSQLASTYPWIRWALSAFVCVDVVCYLVVFALMPVFS